MGTRESASHHSFDETLDVFTRADRPGTPLTTSEVADALDCSCRTAYSRLEELADHGELETKELEPHGRVWWRPIERPRVVEPSTTDALEQAQFQELVKRVSDYAIFVLDPDGIVRTWNEGAKRLKGYEEDEIVGEHFSTFYTEEDRERGRPDRNLSTAVEEGRIEDEGWRVHKDGEWFWANVTITTLYDDEGDVRGFAKVTRDMTDRHRYEERLREQRDELDELNRINRVLRDIDQALVMATSREEIEQAVCDRLASSDTYSAAWIAEYTQDYGEITPRAWAGIGDEYVDAIRTADAEPPRKRKRALVRPRFERRRSSPYPVT